LSQIAAHEVAVAAGQFLWPASLTHLEIVLQDEHQGEITQGMHLAGLLMYSQHAGRLPSLFLQKPMPTSS